MKSELLANLHRADAIDAMAERGLTWDRLIVDIHDPGTLNEKSGIHEYFMYGGCDLGYYTPIMRTLRIHEKPRPWSQQFLASTRVIRRPQ
jgi:hypothetical protein